ncbi:hypothetical protein C6Q13_20150 [Burkholderia gladioli]|nr:hypothetical protein C6Q13_20150 [Burkholderia gladioli]
MLKIGQFQRRLPLFRPRLVPLADALAKLLMRVPVLLVPGVVHLLGHDGVIQPAVAALDPAVQRASADVMPGRVELALVPVAGALGEPVVVVRQRAGGHLVPRNAPEQQR